MAREIFLNTREDMKWLREVHLPRLPVQFKSAIIYGNEDSPSSIHAYLESEPAHDDPYLRFIAKGSGYMVQWVQPD